MTTIAQEILKHKKEVFEAKGMDKDLVSRKVEEEMKQMESVTKATFDTQTAGNGQEYVPAEKNMGDLVSLMTERKGLVAMLQPGLIATSDLGQNRAINIAGELPEARVGGERTTGNIFSSNDTEQFQTGKVIANSDIIKFQFGMSEEFMHFSVVDAERKVLQYASQIIEETIETAALNGDTNLVAASGNINAYDGDPVAVYGAQSAMNQYNRGLRFDAVNPAAVAGVDYIDIGAAAGIDDIFDLLKLLPAEMKQDYGIVMDQATLYEYMKDEDFKHAYAYGSTPTTQTGSLDTLAGIPVVVSKKMRRTFSNGRVSVTPANNTKGQIIIFKRNVIQHGFTRGLETLVQRIPGEGISIYGALSRGFANINKGAGTNTRIVAGINVTI